MMKTHARPSSIYSADDPLAQAIKPPNSESEDEKRARLQAEQEAKRISDEIDDKIKEERERRKKAGAEVKVRTLSVNRFTPNTKTYTYSSSYWVKLSLGNLPFRNNSKSSTPLPPLKRNAMHGAQWSTSTLFVTSNV